MAVCTPDMNPRERIGHCSIASAAPTGHSAPMPMPISARNRNNSEKLGASPATVHKRRERANGEPSPLVLADPRDARIADRSAGVLAEEVGQVRRAILGIAAEIVDVVAAEVAEQQRALTPAAIGPNGVAKRVVSYAVPMVRIHFPPAASHVRT